MKRMRVSLRGAVQGVGFRPFVYKLAGQYRLDGWVSNSNAGVVIEVEGTEACLHDFLLKLSEDRPPHSFIQSLEHTFLDPTGIPGFIIRESDGVGASSALILPDIATCPECIAELFDQRNRRYRYAFINCTHCGPRFSIITGMPYDRPNTSMAGFPMCPACRREYDDPEDRRFHAQPIACPSCGPQLALLKPDGTTVAEGDNALRMAADAVRDGAILALKGIGGFQLIADARAGNVIAVLRERKRREEKPFAVMAPSLEDVRSLCVVSPLEARLLHSSEAPIVLLARHSRNGEITDGVAPGNPALGVMLPYSPLHHLLLRDLGFPVVATSGNLSDEPICTETRDALSRLAGIADVFLGHDRPIVRHVDDSIARIVTGRELILRRARGYAPLPVHMKTSTRGRVLAVGAHLKNTVGLLSGTNAFLSQHIGDLETAQAHASFRSVTADLQNMYGKGDEVVCDLHPDYLSSAFARSCGLPVTAVQHHHAHILSCMAENELEGPVLGVSWDGTGYGTDGTLWGGEFLIAQGSTFQRAATFRPFRLPGGDRAIREPRRSALGIMHEISGDAAFDRGPVQTSWCFGDEESRILKTMLRSGLNSPVTSSAGRLFDAAASILGLRQVSTFEGQAAMELEFAATRWSGKRAIELPVERMRTDGNNAQNSIHQIPLTTILIVDWEPLINSLLEGKSGRVGVEEYAALFHDSLALCIVDMARQIGLERVVLSGGCFQNRILAERTTEGLTKAGFRSYWHQRVPPNDGGIALGQLYAAVLKE